MGKKNADFYDVKGSLKKEFRHQQLDGAPRYPGGKKKTSFFKKLLGLAFIVLIILLLLGLAKSGLRF